MRIYEIACSGCDATHQVAESETAVGAPGQAICSACGGILASWCDRKLKAFRLETSTLLDSPVRSRGRPQAVAALEVVAWTVHDM